MRPLLPVGVVLALAGTLSATAAIPGPGGGPRHISHRGLVLSGHVGGLMPGQRGRLTIRVKNRLHRVVHLRSVRTTVLAAARGCGGRNLVVSAYRGRLRLKPGRTARVTVGVRMRVDSPNACQGKVFPLTFMGQASA